MFYLRSQRNYDFFWKNENLCESTKIQTGINVIDGWWK
jgi:hypothetical protein